MRAIHETNVSAMVFVSLLSAVCGPFSPLVLPREVAVRDVVVVVVKECGETCSTPRGSKLFFFVFFQTAITQQSGGVQSCTGSRGTITCTATRHRGLVPHIKHALLYFIGYILSKYVCRNKKPKLESNLGWCLGGRRLMPPKLRVLNRS